MFPLLTTPKEESFKFNTDGAARGELGPTRIGSMVNDGNGDIVFDFLVPIGDRERMRQNC